MVSDSMQMYLVTIAREQTNQRPVPLSELSRTLSISAVSVNEMCRKLQDSELVQYQPYKGVSLTGQGEMLASKILRKHRLWEVFLVESLGLDYEQAHEIACELEHATPDLLAEHLDRFLEFPTVNPVGKPITASEKRPPEQASIPLSGLSAGQSAVIHRLDIADNPRSYLEKHGLRPGAQVHIQAAFPDSCLLKLESAEFTLDANLIQHIFVFTPQSVQPDMQQDGSSHQTPEHAKERSMHTDTQTRTRHIPLSELQKGQLGIVVHVEGRGAARRRMLDMGLVTGSEIRVIRIAPLGDPIEYSLKGYNLSLRKSEAKLIQVEISEDLQGQ